MGEGQGKARRGEVGRVGLSNEACTAPLRAVLRCVAGQVDQIKCHALHPRQAGPREEPLGELVRGGGGAGRGMQPRG